MDKHDYRSYTLFTGCIIPSKFPFIEKASRKVLEYFDLTLHDMEGASCCPNQMAIQSSDKGLWYLLAARNLCLAERNGHDILSLCNGCYDTLKSVNSRLKGDDDFRDEINGKLADFDLSFSGTLDVKHILQVLHDDIGMQAIERKIVHPLKRMKCAPFEGCHVVRPMDHMGFENPNDAYYLGDIIRVMDGDIVDYAERHSCCGGGLSIGRKHDVAPAARRIFHSTMESGAEAVVVNCPYCFAQFYRNEHKINDIFAERLDMPVFYITQLLGIAMGLDPNVLGMKGHYRHSAGTEEAVVTKILKGSTGAGKLPGETFPDEPTKEQLEICARCLACTDDCQTAMTTSEYHPEELVRLMLEGRVEEALRRPDIWYCMNCHDCIQKCPQNFGMVRLVVYLKNRAVAEGICPEIVEHRRSELHDSGYSFSSDPETREEMGLPEIKGPDMTVFRKLVGAVSRENGADHAYKEEERK